MKPKEYFLPNDLLCKGCKETLRNGNSEICIYCQEERDRRNTKIGNQRTYDKKHKTISK
jgi:hypothetical protein